MLENSVFSVISPEGCAAILWGDRAKAADAADALRLTAEDLVELGIVDGVIPEPAGGAHRDPATAAAALADALEGGLEELQSLSGPELVQQRLEKYRRMGRYLENGTPRGLQDS